MSRTEENKLEDCPFCGAPDDGGLRVATEDKTDLAVAFCRECDAQGPHAQGMVAAIAAWNKPAKRAAELKDMGDKVAESYVAETLITAELRNRIARAEMELAECKKLAISTLCDGDEGHEGPGGAHERVIALAKECVDLTDQAGTTGAAFRDLCLAAEAKDAQAIEVILDLKWRGREQS